MRTRNYRIAALALSALLSVSLASGCAKQQTEERDDNEVQIGYAEAAIIVDDAEALRQAVEEAQERAKQPGVAIHYKPTAYSENGIDFTCDIGNPATSAYDEFITIYGDEAYNDELYVSQLLRPGYTLDSITLNHELNPGSHTVYLAFTQVETKEDGKQAIKGQAYINMEFIVAQ